MTAAPTPGAGRRWLRGAEDGMATAELAVATPAVVIVLTVALLTFRLAVDELRCIDAARAGARAAARGDPDSDVTSTVRRMAPPASQVRIVVGSDTVSVWVEAPGRFSGILPGTMRPTATATAAREIGGLP